LIEDFGDLNLRNDIGGVWENFCILEFLKDYENNAKFGQFCFWRTCTQQEIDFIEERDGILHAFEFKWNHRKKAKLPNSFKDAYPNHTFEMVSQDEVGVCELIVAENFNFPSWKHTPFSQYT